MPTLGHIRGMLLEEALLYLLRRSGYRPVDSIRGDPTLRTHSAGIAVRGRGTDHQIPLFLVSDARTPLRNLSPLIRVRVRYNLESWFLEDVETQRRIFSFDLPTELFNLYAKGGALTAGQAVKMKERMFAAFDAFWWEDTDEGATVHTIRFALDKDWLQEIKTQIRQSEQ